MASYLYDSATGPANRAWTRLAARLDAEDPNGEVTAAWAVAKTS